MPLPPKENGDALWFTATATGLEGVESQWAKWSGVWAIVSGLDTGGEVTTLLSGDMSKDADTLGKFYVNITATQMTTLGIGWYTLLCQAISTDIDYKETFIREPLQIVTQGIV